MHPKFARVLDLYKFEQEVCLKIIIETCLNYNNIEEWWLFYQQSLVTKCGIQLC